MTQDRRSRRGTSLLRLRVGFILIAMVVSVFGARLFQLQGVDPKAYAARAEAVARGEFEQATALFEDGFARARHLHDWLFRWAWAIGTAAA